MRPVICVEAERVVRSFAGFGCLVFVSRREIATLSPIFSNSKYALSRLTWHIFDSVRCTTRVSI